MNKNAEIIAKKLITLAFKFHLEGNILEAEKYYQIFLDKGFTDARANSNLGQILRIKGNLKKAELLTRQAVKLDPNFADAYCNLGVILIDLGQLKEAEIFIRKAIKLNPDFANAFSNLGLILQKIGKLKEAEISYRRAIQLNPNFADAFSNLGLILQKIGKLKEAEISARKAIEINPNFANAYCNLGSILHELGNLKEAEIFTRKAIKLNPNFANAYCNLGSLLQELGNLKEAEIFTRKAIKLNPAFAIAFSNLGNILNDLGQLKEAEISYHKAIQLNPNFTNTYFNLFHYYEQINKLEKLNDTLNKFKKVKCINNELKLFQARLKFRNKDYKAAKKLINNISPKWIEKNNDNQNTIFWNYKAFIEDKIQNYDVAYSCFEKSQHASMNLKFDKNLYLKFINSYKKNITNKKRIFYQFNDGIEDSNLSFLIGFPRSGTTLLDTILRSHKNIEVIEEKPLIPNIEKLIKEKFYKKLDNIVDISEDNLIILRKKYFELLSKFKNKNVKILIDKLPLNTVSLPLINLIFPNAKIIFTHRHPYDTVLSCFQQCFTPNIAMANLKSLKSSSIMYNEVMNAWDLYKNNLSLNHITSKYENLIEDFDGQIDKILQFLDLEWDENIKNYRKTAFERTKINTPSFSQVIHPLYKSSIDKWKNYEKYFEGCHQYLDPWVAYFDY